VSEFSPGIAFAVIDAASGYLAVSSPGADSTNFKSAIGVAKYYHVMKKNGAWHLYAGNSAAALVTDSEQARVVKAARSLARQSGARIVFHKTAGDAAHGATSASNLPPKRAG